MDILHDIIILLSFIIGYQIGKHGAVLTDNNIKSLRDILPHKKAIIITKQDAPKTNTEQLEAEALKDK